jgi:hypothetical protein
MKSYINENEVLYTKEYRDLAKQKQNKLKIVRKAERFADKVEKVLFQKAPPKRGT